MGPLRLILLPLAIALAACASGDSSTPGSSPTGEEVNDSGQEVVARFLLGGWVLPYDTEAADDPFAETLKTFVITSEEELREFLSGLDLVRLRGSADTLSRTDFEELVVVAVYYLWRPLKGNPLSMKAVRLKDTDLTIVLDMEDEPLGKEYPYLLAPMYIIGLERDRLPSGVPLTLRFELNGSKVASSIVVLE